MANALDFNGLLEKRQEFVDRAKDLIDKAVESGKSYVEVTRSTIEAETQDLLGKVRDASAKSQVAIQEQFGKQLETIQSFEKTAVEKAESIIAEYGPEIEKRIPAASSAVELAEQLLKNADERVSALFDTAAKAANTNPIENYDDLNVANVKKAVQSLSATELAVVREYEASNKNRKSVLKELDDLLSA